MRVLRSIGSVLAGHIAFSVCAFAMFTVLGYDPHAGAALPVMAAITAAGMVFAAGGGYLAALLAGRSPLAHAGALAGLILLVAIASAASQRGGNWTQLAGMLLIAPSALVGGWLRARQLRQARA